MLLMGFKADRIMGITMAIIISILLILIVIDTVGEAIEQEKLCKGEGGDYCLTEEERKCKEACGEKYFYTRDVGVFSSSTTCTCGT